MNTIHTITIKIETTGNRYRGIVVTDGQTQLSRHQTGDWVADYKKAFQEGKRKVGSGGVVLIDESVFMYRALTASRKRTKFHNISDNENKGKRAKQENKIAIVPTDTGGGGFEEFDMEQEEKNFIEND